MNAKQLISILLVLMTPALLMAQSATTEALKEKHSGSLELFFYNNTLKMLNQADDKDFDEFIKDIEKMRFLMIKKDETNFGKNDLNKLISDYKAEAFQEIMASRHEGKNFNVYLKENDGKTKGMLVLVNDSKNLYVLDILGAIALDKVTKFYSALDASTDIGSKIKAFAGHGDESEKKSDENH